jgi:hypothetical protein
VSTSAAVTFPSWVPTAIIHEAEQPHAGLASEENPGEALEVWSRLVLDSRMERVWRELYKRKRTRSQATEEFFYPACVTKASIAARNRRRASELRKKGGPINERDADLLEAEAALEEGDKDPPADPRWSEQDRGVQLFLHRAYKAALDHELVFLSDLKEKVSKLQNVAKRLRCDASILSSLGMKREARKLRRIASDCDDDASAILPDRDSDGSVLRPQVDYDPWIITRRRKNLELRTFVASLSITTEQLFGEALCGALATISNVRFNRADVTRGKVREMLHP